MRQKPASFIRAAVNDTRASSLPLVHAGRGGQRAGEPFLETAMPVATVPDVLSPLLCQRLAHSWPPEHHAGVFRELGFLLETVRNLPPVTLTPPPVAPNNPWAMAQVYQRLVLPKHGSPFGPLTSDEDRAVRAVHYLYEVQVAPPLEDTAMAVPRRPQSAIHARVLNEVRREFSLLPFPKPDEGWERAVHDVAARLMEKSIRMGVQPTEVVVVGAREMPPRPGRHMGGVSLHLAGWNGAAPPPEHTAETANPNVWDPNNPLGNEPNLLRAPLQLDWIGIRSLPAM